MARCKGYVLPTMRQMSTEQEIKFSTGQLGAARTAAWFLHRYEGMYFEVHKNNNYTSVKRTL